MKILSNFDTRLPNKLGKKYAEEYGEDNVMVIHINNVFLWLFVFAPLIFYILLVIAVIYVGFIFDLGDETLNTYKRYVLLIFIFFISLLVAWKLLKKFIDFNLDFAVITPDSIIAYKQDGIFSRNSRTIRCSRLKTITVSKEGILRSIFDYGSLVFLSEGDASSEGSGDIELSYIHNPDSLKYEVRKIIVDGNEEKSSNEKKENTDKEKSQKDEKFEI